MSDSPYIEGWPKEVENPDALGELETVVPLADAERMREALQEIWDECERTKPRDATTTYVDATGFAEHTARAALTPEQPEES